jgi:[acyl-carrier-protein] S-malonyltransferase
MLAFLFPGQGSQAVGMGQALAQAFPIAKQTFEEADEALADSLSRVCFEGPESALRQTANTQPAILTVSTALTRILQQERPDLRPALCAGHSLGEWSALVSVGGVSFGDAVRAVRERGRLMQDAVPEGLGAMAAVVGLSPERVREICIEVETHVPGEVVRPANFNSDEQTVISGHRTAVERAGRALNGAGAKRVLPLPVSAPFHCPLMKPAAEGLEIVLSEIEIASMSAPVVTNVEAAANKDPDRVRSLLIEQVTAPVRWTESVRKMVEEGIASGLELGPGKVLSGLARRIDRRLRVRSVSDPNTLARALEGLES